MNWPWLDAQIVAAPSAADRADAGMRLQIGLVHRLGRVAPLDNDVGQAEAGLAVALLEPELLGNVRRLLGLPARRLAVNMSSWSTGASAAIASSQSITYGNASYSTSIRSSASAATIGEFAATAATACPSYSTLSRAMTLRDRSRKFIGPSPTKASSERDFREVGRQVTTARNARRSASGTFSVSILTMRACGYGLRLILACSMPGIFMSAPKLARPASDGLSTTPSGRIGQVPTTFEAFKFSRRSMPWPGSLCSLFSDGYSEHGARSLRMQRLGAGGSPNPATREAAFPKRRRGTLSRTSVGCTCRARNRNRPAGKSGECRSRVRAASPMPTRERPLLQGRYRVVCTLLPGNANPRATPVSRHSPTIV